MKAVQSKYSLITNNTNFKPLRNLTRSNRSSVDTKCRCTPINKSGLQLETGPYLHLRAKIRLRPSATTAVSCSMIQTILVRSAQVTNEVKSPEGFLYPKMLSSLSLVVLISSVHTRWSGIFSNSLLTQLLTVDRPLHDRNLRCRQVEVQKPKGDLFIHPITPSASWISTFLVSRPCCLVLRPVFTRDLSSHLPTSRRAQRTQTVRSQS